MYQINQLRNGLRVQLGDDPYVIVDVQHVKPGKGSAFARTKLKNLRTGRLVEETFKAGDKVAPAAVEEREMQLLYRDGEDLHFMDSDTFEQVAVKAELIGQAVDFLREGVVAEVLFDRDIPIGVTPPSFVVLRVIRTDPGLRGDTATGGTKPATVETGAVVQVPLFINEGDRLKVDTRSGTYIERVN